MNTTVSQSITRKSASNLAMAFILLPPDKRQEMAALYAFCREVDDVADETSRPLEERRAALAAWRTDVRAACERGTPRFAVNRELQPVIERRQLPFKHFDELLRGVEMDLDLNRYETYADLEAYCFRVASVVGLLSIEVFGYTNLACRDYAVYLGKALQFTNILRDVRADAERDRLYLPLEELRRHSVTPEEILRGEYSPRFRAAAESVAERARGFYRLARQTLPPEDRRSMATAELMGSVYWRLLGKLQARQFNVFGAERTRVGRGQKLLLVVRSLWRLMAGGFEPSYGVP